MNTLRKLLKTCLSNGMVLCLILPAFAQDSNILHPIAEIEQKLKYEPFDIVKIRPSRFKGDMTKRAILRYSDNKVIQVKWKRCAPGGSATNNQPRYEISAYEIQKLFLDPKDFVVPPTIARCLPVTQYHDIEPNVNPTFKNTPDVFYVLQYWLEAVSHKKIFDKKRFKSDSLYAWHLGNMNILSYLIEHKDANVGNFLISTDPQNPRVFAVDNGFAFKSPESDQGSEWRRIRVKRLPKETVDRLRKITREDLEKTLGVVAQFEIKDGYMIPVEPSENLNKKKGVRHTDHIIQFGLTGLESSVRGLPGADGPGRFCFFVFP
ncbi:MAG: hypothetical protein ACE5G1_17840 [bacterium]